MKTTITKILDKIYHVKCENHYDLAMLFLRYQEFYESSNPQFKGKAFTILDFMDWYSKDRQGYFSYPLDWAGFNLPSKIISNVNKLTIPDDNKYDEEMRAIYSEISAECGEKFYLIGGAGEFAIKHETAHGLFYTKRQYKQEMKNLLDSLDKELYDKMCVWLGSLGYTSQVFEDEIQAYFSTGLDRYILSSWKKEAKTAAKPFEKVFEKYSTEMKIVA